MKKEENNNIEEKEVETTQEKNKKEDNAIEELKAQLKQEKEKSDEYYEHLKRNMAEFDNFKKRISKEKDMMYNTISADIVSELLPILDNFERAIKLDDNDLTDELSKFLAGFKMMYASLNEALKKFGVEEISRIGEIFDPSQEQALLTDSLEDHQEDEVLEVLLKGYKLKDRVIRPASVKINQI